MGGIEQEGTVAIEGNRTILQLYTLSTVEPNIFADKERARKRERGELVSVAFIADIQCGNSQYAWAVAVFAAGTRLFHQAMTEEKAVGSG